jgi:hypothetical protein
MRRAAFVLLALIATVGVSACSDDPTGPGDPLTTAERALLAQSLFAFGFEATATDPPGANAGPAAADFAVQLDLTVPCPVAGNVDISGSLDGTVDDQSGALAFDYVLAQTHQGCVVRSEDGSVELRIDGEPGTTLAYSISASEGAYEASGTLEGGVRYTSGDRSGVCTTDLSWSGSGAIDGGGSFSLSGTICGTSVSTTFSGT